MNTDESKENPLSHLIRSASEAIKIIFLKLQNYFYEKAYIPLLCNQISLATINSFRL